VFYYLLTVKYYFTHYYAKHATAVEYRNGRELKGRGVVKIVMHSLGKMASKLTLLAAEGS